MTSASEWAKRVKAWRASGKGPQEFCEGREFSAKALQWWWSRFRRHGFPGKATGPERGASPSGPSGRGRGAALARVVRRAEDVRVRDGEGSAGSAVVIEFGDARVRVEVGCSRAALAMVVDVLRCAASGAR